MNELVKGPKMSSIILMKFAGALVNQKGFVQPFEKAPLGFEGSLPYIKGFNLYVVITKLQVNLSKIFGPFKLVQKAINLRD